MYKFVLNSRDGVAIILRAESPVPAFQARCNHELQTQQPRKGSHEVTLDDIAPPVSLSSILDSEWLHASEGQQRSKSRTPTEHLSYVVMQEPTLSDNARAIINALLVEKYGTSNVVPPYPGINWYIGEAGFNALLSTEELQPLVWLLAERKRGYDNKVLTGVTMFKGIGSDDDHPSFIWTLGTADEGQIALAALRHYWWATYPVIVSSGILRPDYIQRDPYLNRYQNWVRQQEAVGNHPIRRQPSHDMHSEHHYNATAKRSSNTHGHDPVEGSSQHRASSPYQGTLPDNIVQERKKQVLAWVRSMAQLVPMPDDKTMLAEWDIMIHDPSGAENLKLWAELAPLDTLPIPEPNWTNEQLEKAHKQVMAERKAAKEAKGHTLGSQGTGKDGKDQGGKAGAGSKL